MTAAAARDRRIGFHGPASGEEAAVAVHDAHVTVVCPRFDVLPELALRSLALNRPVLGTPVGALPEVADWLAAGTEAADLAAAISDLRADPDGYLRLGDGPSVRAAAWPAAAPLPRPAPRAIGDPDVRAVVVHRGDLGATERTLDALTLPSVTVVGDGLGALERRRGVRVVADGGAGAAAARNLGVAVAAGDLVLVLDGGDVPEPAFVDRALRAFARDPGLAYVTSWTDYERPLGVDDGYIDDADVGGAPAALVRPEVFEQHPQIDGDRARWWHGQLWRRGLRGAVIPEVLLHTASRPSLGDEAALRAAHRARAVRWTAG